MADHALELQYDSVLKSAKIIFNHISTYSFNAVPDEHTSYKAICSNSSPVIL